MKDLLGVPRIIDFINLTKFNELSFLFKLSRYAECFRNNFSRYAECFMNIPCSVKVLKAGGIATHMLPAFMIFFSILMNIAPLESISNAESNSPRNNLSVYVFIFHKSRVIILPKSTTVRSGASFSNSFFVFYWPSLIESSFYSRTSFIFSIVDWIFMSGRHAILFSAG